VSRIGDRLESGRAVTAQGALEHGEMAHHDVGGATVPVLSPGGVHGVTCSHPHPRSVPSGEEPDALGDVQGRPSASECELVRAPE
jgi:hypothetical protein